MDSDSWIEAEVNFFRREKLCRRDYLDYLKNKAKSGDMAVLDLTFRKVSLGKWSKNWSGYRRYRALLQKTPILLRSLLIVATPYKSAAESLDMSLSGEKVTKMSPKLLLYHITVERIYIYRERMWLKCYSNYYCITLLWSENISIGRESY